MSDAAFDGLKIFVKKNFRLLKVKGAHNRLIGRRTYAWALGRLDKSRLSHLTQNGLDDLALRLDLKMIEFDDGNIYYVYPPAEREILVDFYSQIEEAESAGRPATVEDAAPVPANDFVGNYRISEAAVFVLTGDSVQDLELTDESVIDFISGDAVEAALDEGGIRLYYDDGVCTVLSAGEEAPESETYPFFLDRLLPGTEVSLDELDLPQKTKITGAYRDQVGKPKDEM